VPSLASTDGSPLLVEDSEEVADQMECRWEDYQTLGSSLFSGSSVAPLVVAGPAKSKDSLFV